MSYWLQIRRLGIISPKEKKKKKEKEKRQIFLSCNWETLALLFSMNADISCCNNSDELARTLLQKYTPED
jgi:hypothetical protein